MPLKFVFVRKFEDFTRDLWKQVWYASWTTPSMYFEEFTPKQENMRSSIQRLTQEAFDSGKFEPYGVCSDETAFVANVFPAVVRANGAVEVCVTLFVSNETLILCAYCNFVVTLASRKIIH